MVKMDCRLNRFKWNKNALNLQKNIIKIQNNNKNIECCRWWSYIFGFSIRFRKQKIIEITIYEKEIKISISLIDSNIIVKRICWFNISYGCRLIIYQACTYY
jgi:hypothetical protein